MPVFAGASYQRGYGLGGVMKNIIRQATPLLKQAGKQALKTGISVVARGIVGPQGKRPRKVSRKTKRKTRTPTKRKTPSPFRGPIASPASQKRRLKTVGFRLPSPLNRPQSLSPLSRRMQAGSGKTTALRQRRRVKRRRSKDIFSHK